ncbi:MAG: epimerase [Bacteroidetes bacterium]|nr:MAG: epimerase [Bacteroidota bacterium]
MKLKCCIIGGSGFIGSRLIKLLVEKGREIHVVDINPMPEVVNGVHYHPINVQDDKELLVLLSGMDEMVYLAHDGFPALHNVDPEHEVKVNIFYTVQLFRQLHKTSLKKIIYFSSGGAVYGHTDKAKLKETDETAPVSSYGIAKLAMEKYLQIFYETNGLPIITVRPSNAYGPGQIPFRGQGFVATAIKRVQQNKPITIFGKEGTIRDYLYIDDLVAATVGLLDKGKTGETYNIGTESGHSNLEVIRMMEQVAEKQHIKVVLNREPRRPFDVNFNVLDSTKLTQTTGWKPATSLEEGIEKTWEWLEGRFEVD